MFRLHRSDGLVLAMIVLTAGLGVAFWGGTTEALEAIGLRSAARTSLAEGPPPSPAAGPAVPLEINSLTSGFSLTGVYPGWMSLEDGDLVFRISSASLRTRPDSKGEQTLMGIRVALARESGSSWNTVEQSALFPIRTTLERGRTYGLRNIELRIAGVRSWDLQNAWPVLIHELHVRSDDPDRTETQAWTYAHGPRGSLDLLRRLAEG